MGREVVSVALQAASPPQVVRRLGDWLREPEHAFTREWLRAAARGVTDLRAPEFATGLRMNMPREYAMIHRVFVGSTGVLCQLGATIPARGSMERLLPGFVEG